MHCIQKAIIVLAIAAATSSFSSESAGETNYYKLFNYAQEVGSVIMERNVIGDRVVTKETWKNPGDNLHRASISTETLDGKPIEFEFVDYIMTNQYVKYIVRDNGEMTVIRNMFGQPSVTNLIDYPKGATMLEGTRLFRQKQGLKPGTKYTSLEICYQCITDICSVVVGDVKRIKLLDREVDAVTISEKVSPRNYPRKKYVDQNGKLLRNEDVFDNGRVVMILSDSFSSASMPDNQSAITNELNAGKDRPDISQPNSDTRIALVCSDTEDSSGQLLDPAIAQLSAAGCVMVERQEIKQLLQEQRLSRAIGDQDNLMAIGKILRADLIASIEVWPGDQAVRELVVFDTVRGVRLVEVALSGQSKAVIEQIVVGVAEARQKYLLLGQARHNTTVCILPARNVDLPPKIAVACQAVPKLLERQLVQAPGITMLERKQMGVILRENKISTNQYFRSLLGATVTVAIEFRRGNSNQVVADVSLCDANSLKMAAWSTTSDVSRIDNLSLAIHNRILESLGKQKIARSFNPDIEGLLFERESHHLFDKGCFEDALASATAAYAFSPSPFLYAYLVRCQMGYASELLNSPPDSEKRKNGISLVGDVIQNRLQALNSAQIDNGSDLIYHLSFEWRGFHDIFKHIARQFIVPDKSRITYYEGVNRVNVSESPGAREVFLDNRRYLDNIIERFAAMAPTDAVAMNTFSWFLAEPLYYFYLKYIFWQHYPDPNEASRRHQDLGLKWLAALAARGFDDGAVILPNEVFLDIPGVKGVGDLIQGCDPRAAIVPNSVLFSLINLPNNGAFTTNGILGAMDRHREPLVQVYGKIGRLCAGSQKPQDCVERTKLSETIKHSIVELLADARKSLGFPPLVGQLLSKVKL